MGHSQRVWDSPIRVYASYSPMHIPVLDCPIYVHKMRCFALYTDALANSSCISIIDAILQLSILAKSDV